MPAIETEEAPACQRMDFPAENSPITKKACSAVIHVCGRERSRQGFALVMGLCEGEEKCGWELIRYRGWGTEGES